MPHVTGHSPHGGGTSKGINDRKQAAQSMMSAGISSVSGSTTSDKKGDRAKKIQENFQRDNNNNRNNNVTPIIPKPKPKPKPDEEKKEFRVTIPGKDPEVDDRPTSGVTTGIMDKDTTSNNLGLEYDMTLKGADVVPASFGLMDTTPTESVLQNETFQVSMADYVMNNIPEEYHSTISASYILTKAAITGDIELQKDLTDNSKISFKVNNWGKNMGIMYKLTIGNN